MKDLTAAIKIQDTMKWRTWRARLEAELFRFEECWADMRVAEAMAKTDEDKEWIRLSLWSVKETEKEANKVLGVSQSK